MEINQFSSYVLHNDMCDICVWGEDGFYNPVCAHCSYVQYGKRNEPSLMTRGVAEMLGLVQPKEYDVEP